MRFPCPVCGDDAVEIRPYGEPDPDTGTGQDYEVIGVACPHQPQITPDQWDDLWRRADDAHADQYR